MNKTFDLHLLRSFEAVADEGQLTRACDRLHLSQPAVSAHIKTLERELDIRLFERQPAGMALTPAGRDLRVHARAILAAVEAMRNAAAQLKGELIGTLRVGSVSDPQSNRVGDLLSLTVSRYPRLQLELHHAISGAALVALRERALDASFYFGDAPGPEYLALPLAQIVYRVAAAGSWADRVVDADWAALSALPWVRPPAISTHRQLVDQLFASHGVQVSPHRIEADDESVIVNLIVAGVGLSLIREDIARPLQRAGKICVWPREKLHTTLWFVCSRTRADEPLIRALLGCVREIWRSPTPRTRLGSGSAS